MPSKRRPLVIGAVCVGVIALVVGGTVVVRWITSGPDSRLAAAVAMAPVDSQRLTWTDWAKVRAATDSSLDADPEPEQVRAMLEAGFEQDLTSASTLVDSAPSLQDKYGVSPATLEWELLAQSETGQLVLMGLPENFGFDDFGGRLDGLGYQPPKTDDGVWRGSPELLLDIGTLSPELTNLRIDQDAGVLMASSSARSLATDVSLRGDDRSDGISEVVATYDDDARAATSAVIYSGAQACKELAMSRADETEQSTAAQLIADAGEVHPMQGFAIVVLPEGKVDVTMAFESEEIARSEADTRTQLASGPAPGQGGDFSDRFELGQVTADDTTVNLPLDPVDGAYVLSDLSSGPVLFATC